MWANLKCINSKIFTKKCLSICIRKWNFQKHSLFLISFWVFSLQNGKKHTCDLDIFFCLCFSLEYIFTWISIFLRSESKRSSSCSKDSPKFCKFLRIISTANRSFFVWLRRCFSNEKKQHPGHKMKWALSVLLLNCIDGFWQILGSNLRYSLFCCTEFLYL